jgi:putative ABC transport system permease protein
VRQLATESAVLAIGGSIVGLLMAHWGLAALKWGIPAEMRTYMPGWREIGLNFRALGFALACAIASGLVVGLAPAWRCSRADSTESLKEGGRGGGGSRVRTRLRSVLVAGELAAAVVLVIGAGLMVRGFHSLVEGGARFQPDSLLTLRVSLNQNRYSTPPMLAAFFRDARDRVAALPGVRSAFVVSAVPFSRTSDAGPFIVEGSTQKPSPVQLRAVSADYFRALNVPLLSGSTSLEAPRSAVISQSMAQRWSLEPGRRIQLRPPDGPHLVIAGIVGDVQQTILSGDPTPTIYMSYEQFPRREMDIGIRTSGDALRLATAVRAAVREVDREQPITNVSTLAGLIYQEAFVFAYMAALMGIFGLVALGLSAIGVYGVMSYVVGQQQHEIGVRMALGAQRGTVLAMLLRRGMRTAVAGLMLGMVPAYALARLMRSAIWGVTLDAPALFIAIPLSLLAAAALAIYIPARRGTRIDPLQALRGE